MSHNFLILKKFYKIPHTHTPQSIKTWNKVFQYLIWDYGMYEPPRFFETKQLGFTQDLLN